jgi:hypothetical protein
MIERSGHFDREVSGASWKAIEELNKLASIAFIDFVIVEGEVKGKNYTTKAVSYDDLEDDLKPYLNQDETILLQESTNEFSLVTSVRDAQTGAGVVRQRYHDGSVEYYESDPEIRTSFGGYNLLDEIFVPGSYPELSDLAASTKGELVNPEELKARITTPEEYKRMNAVAKLSKITTQHLVDLKEIYWEVAYPGTLRTVNGDDESRILQDLRVGEYIGLRTNTKFLNCAKHVFSPSLTQDTLTTNLYLNYDINIGRNKLHFREDIEMALSYGDKANEYFEAENISTTKLD